MAALLVIADFLYYRSQDGRIYLNGDGAGMLLLKGGYRSWNVDWSHGQTWDRNGHPYHLYHWPTFRHLDMRRINFGFGMTNFGTGTAYIITNGVGSWIQVP